MAAHAAGAVRRFTSTQETTRFGVTFRTENKVDFEDKPKFSGVANPVLGSIVDRFSRVRQDLGYSTAFAFGNVQVPFRISGPG